MGQVVTLLSPPMLTRNEKPRLILALMWPASWPIDFDCQQIAFTGFQVLPSDPHEFDGNNNSIGCES